MTRAGSRTLLWDLKSPELGLELARRGYRLMLLRAEGEELPPIRALLAQSGLSSQLMGSGTYRPDSLSLARQFYELVIFCEGVPIEPAMLEPALRPGTQVVWQKGQYQPTLPYQSLSHSGEFQAIRYQD